MKPGSFVIIEATDFTSAAKEYFGDEFGSTALQYDLMANPQWGGVIPGAWPVRKARWSDPRRGVGRLGGLCINYIHIPEINVLYLMSVTGRDEVDVLTAKEKRVLRELSRELVEGLKERHAKRKL